jgi:3-oxoacyl-[acyl-carrier-protein] synthase-1
MRVASANWLDTGLGGAERFEALLLPAIEQSLSPVVSGTAPLMRCALMLGLPSSRPGLQESLQSHILARIQRRYGDRLVSVSAYPAGHAAGLLALESAIEMLAQGSLDGCVVASVDSYLEPETLHWIESCDQFHGAGRLNNAWGFIPGEAAGAVLVLGARAAEKMRFKPLAHILGTGSAHEPKRIKTRTVCIGEGLTQAFRAALAALPAGTQVSDVYCDMNGEPYRADEYGFACLRTKEAFMSVSDFVAPADCWGDVGAAGASLHLVLAAIAGANGYARGGTALIWASAEKGERAAALVATGTRE